MNELASILGGAPGKPPKAAKTYEPFDAAVRTVLAEESDPAAQEWVAGVIANRLKAAGEGKTFYDVVTEKNQFEPWARGTAQKVDPQSKAYKETAERVRDILEGKRDPSGGATHFYAPEAQAQLAQTDGRPVKPDWDDGTGVPVGRSLFFRKGGAGAPSEGGGELAGILGGGAAPEASGGQDEADKAFLATFGDPSKFDGPDTGLAGAGVVPFDKIEGTLNKAQTETWKTWNKGNFIDPKAEVGSERNPRWLTPDTTEKDVPDGTYYVDAKGEPKFKGDLDGSFLKGLQRGGADTLLSLAQILPGTDDSELRNRLEAGQQSYDAGYKGDLLSGMGRFTGQVGAAALPVGGTQLLLGKALAPAAASFLTRPAIAGAVAGAEGAALTSSATDASLGEDLAAGAVGGAILGRATPAIAQAGRGMVDKLRTTTDRFTEGGRERIIGRLVDKLTPDGPPTLDTRIIIPGSEPTLAEAAANPGISVLERNARTNPQLATRLQARLDANDKAREAFFERLQGDDVTLESLKDAREAATKPLREAALAVKVPADPKPVVAKINEILKSPEGQRDAVVDALTNIRGKLKTGNKYQTDVEQLYGIRKAIGDLLDSRASSGKSDARLAAAELKVVQKEIDNAIEKVSPDWKKYLATYSDMSKPVDEQTYLQSLKLVDTKGRITLAKVQGAIDKITTMRKKPGANEAKSISKDTLSALRDLRDDLKRSGNIDVGKARGSDTEQNRLIGKITGDESLALGAGAGVGAITGSPMAAAAAAGSTKKVLGGKNLQLLDQLGERLLQPGMSIPIKAQPRPRILGRAPQTAIPLTGGVLGATVGAGEQ